jgi:hypothetical protein
VEFCLFDASFRDLKRPMKKKSAVASRRTAAPPTAMPITAPVDKWCEFDDVGAGELEANDGMSFDASVPSSGSVSPGLYTFASFARSLCSAKELAPCYPVSGAR